MTAIWIKRAIVDAWASHLVSFLSLEASGFRSAELEGETLSVRFSSFVDGALVFPFFKSVATPLQGDVGAEAFTVNPNFSRVLRELGFSLKAPVRDGGEFVQLGEGAIAGYKSGLILAANRFRDGFPVVMIELHVELTFNDEIHDDIFLLAGREIRAGRQLGEFLEEKDARSNLLAPSEFAALHALWSRWNAFFQSMILSRVTPRQDFYEHVVLRHGITLAEVTEALTSQVADPVPEGRSDRLKKLGERGLKRVAVLGVTEAGRVIEIILEAGGDGVTVVTAFEPERDDHIAWWLGRAGGGSSNERIAKSHRLARIYKGIKGLR